MSALGPAPLASLIELASVLDAARPTPGAWRQARTVCARLLREVHAAGGGPAVAPVAPAAVVPPSSSRLLQADAFRALVARIEAARTREELAQLGAQVAAAVATEALTPQQSQAITGAIRTAANVLKHLPSGGEETGLAVLLTAEAADLAERYEGILDARRRARARAAVEAEAVEDEARYPPDARAQPGEIPSRLAADGLDAWGDPS